MSEEIENNEVPKADEADLIRQRLDLMGIKYHHKAGVEKLRALLDEAQNPPKEEAAPVGSSAAASELRASQKVSEQRMAAKRMKRIIVTCLDQNKKDWPGEIFAAGNRFIGNIKKYVPFDNQEGWYVHEILIRVIKSKKMRISVEKRNERGDKYKISRLVPMYNVVELPDLSEQEFQQLRERQALQRANENA